jgi:HEXXH motif-containing protein
MNSSDERLQKAILATLLCPTDPWLPELTELLVRSGWKALNEEIGILPATYSTTNVMRRDPTALATNMLRPIRINADKFHGCIEFLASDVQAYFESKDYRFPDTYEADDTRLVETLSSALESISLVPPLYAATSQLTRCVHLLQSKTENCDISFSDPRVPFSIFVSIPEKDSSNASLRIAEAVIHESMHLQLSLLERITPIALSQSPAYYSPWKQTNRNASGVMHALYVFTVIDAWLKRLPDYAHNYSIVRGREIAEQVAEIEPFECAELTNVGNALRRYLFSQH